MAGEGELNLALARSVRRLRERKGWSQEQLAHECGVHRTYIGSIERGERNVTLATVQKIANALGVQPLALLEGPKR
jgi:transcriptional regulator with XRE-family HTH domain